MMITIIVIMMKLGTYKLIYVSSDNLKIGIDP